MSRFGVFDYPGQRVAIGVASLVCFAGLGGCGGLMSGDREDTTRREQAGGSSGYIEQHQAGGQMSTGGAPPSSTGGVPQTGGAAQGGFAGVSLEGGSCLPCLNPTPLPGADGRPTGYVTCEGGAIHRTERMDCPSAVSRTGTTCELTTPGDGSGERCTSDADCTSAPHGFCTSDCYCFYGCVRDEECPSGSICLCNELAGRCVPSTCGSDQECGQCLCLSYYYYLCPGYPSFTCQTARDTCVGDQDCSSYDYCSFDGDHHFCKTYDCFF